MPQEKTVNSIAFHAKETKERWAGAELLDASACAPTSEPPHKNKFRSKIQT
jgi:hypothetical protein